MRRTQDTREGPRLAKLDQQRRLTCLLRAPLFEKGARDTRLLIKDLDKDLTEAETTEKDSQANYEELMRDSAQKRALDSTTLTDKTSTKASVEGDLEAQAGAKASATKELMATFEYIQSLHGECDFLLQYFDVRKEARAGEVDALGKAKDVLSGADYSLLQQAQSSRGLRGRVSA